ncbi:MAG: oligosaccharide flippase family protein, partial [Clostridia bacterium]
MSKTAKSFAIVTGFSVATRLISFGFKIWMSRSLGAETVGLYQICMSVLVLLFTLTAGAPTVLSRKVAEAVSRGDIKRKNALTTASITLGLGLSVTICALFYIFSSKLGFLFADSRCMDIFLIMLPALITSTLYVSFRSWFWGHKRFLAFSSTELADEVIKIVLSIVFAGGLISSLTGAKGIALAFTISDLLCVLILMIMFFVAGGKFAKPAGYKEIVTATLPLSATRIISTLTASMTALVLPERLVATGMTNAMATAAYGRVAGMALPLITAPITIVSALSVVLTPDIAELRAKGQFDVIRQKLTNSMTFAILISAVFFVLYLPLGQQVGYLFFKDALAGEFVSYCSVLLFPVAIAQVTTPMLNSLGCEKNTFVNSLAGALCLIPCILFLPKYIG